MDFPSPGYDDDSVIPQKRLGQLLDRFEEELKKVSRVFLQYLPGQFESPNELERDITDLRIGAAELGEEYSFLVEKLIADYRAFQNAPEQEKLDQVFIDLKRLELLLIG